MRCTCLRLGFATETKASFEENKSRLFENLLNENDTLKDENAKLKKNYETLLSKLNGQIRASMALSKEIKEPRDTSTYNIDNKDKELTKKLFYYGFYDPCKILCFYAGQILVT